jgi:hypothetical protein
VTVDISATNTQLFRPQDATDPVALARISPERSALVRELTSRPRDGHRAVERADLPGELTKVIVPLTRTEPSASLPTRKEGAALAGEQATSHRLKPRWRMLAGLLGALPRGAR